MDKLLLVGLGGCLGSVGRYLAHVGLQRISEAYTYPFGILSVNVVGCFLIGALDGWVETAATGSRLLASERFRLFLFVGVLGGFTTFSSFGLDTVGFLREERLGRALLNVFLNVSLGLLAVWCGLVSAQKIASHG